ncbi:MAG: hypothetical protein HFE41_04820 [Clostridia bacterium]|jgi:anti-sigma regulatory factor (Ser/Thr protein kinase)|nr:hypothetical protein [Clostridia bacterium]
MIVNFKVDDLKKMNEQLRAFDALLRKSGVREDDIFLCRLASCELISNVIIHGKESAGFEGELLDDRICITVKATGMELADTDASLPSVLAESGRGMFIVKSICFGAIERTDGGLRIFIKRTE